MEAPSSLVACRGCDVIGGVRNAHALHSRFSTPHWPPPIHATFTLILSRPSCGACIDCHSLSGIGQDPPPFHKMHVAASIVPYRCTSSSSSTPPYLHDERSLIESSSFRFYFSSVDRIALNTNTLFFSLSQVSSSVIPGAGPPLIIPILPHTPLPDTQR